MTKHVYRYLQTVKSDRGHKTKLRRDDGKIVRVSRQRLNQLADEKRLVKQLPYETAL